MSTDAARLYPTTASSSSCAHFRPILEVANHRIETVNRKEPAVASITSLTVEQRVGSTGSRIAVQRPATSGVARGSHGLGRPVAQWTVGIDGCLRCTWIAPREKRAL